MALGKREKILAGATALLLLGAAANIVFSVLGTSTSGRSEQRDQLAADIEKKKLTALRGDKAAARLAEWRKRSLPADRELGRSLYQNWLSELLDQVGFKRSRVESGEGRMHHNAYYLFPFTVRGQGNMQELVRFLFAFYRAGHMHQIRHLSIKPLENGRGLDLVITIEALSLPGATSQKLSTEPGTRLALSAPDEYLRVIVGRDLLSPYTPKSNAPASTGRPQFDPSKYAYLTAILAVGGRPQAWFVARTTDQVFKLSEGEEFTVGPVRPKVVRINGRTVELEIDGARYLVPLGTSLGERQPLSAGGTARPQ
jgi:hypothetical protein